MFIQIMPVRSTRSSTKGVEKQKGKRVASSEKGKGKQPVDPAPSTSENSKSGKPEKKRGLWQEKAYPETIDVAFMPWLLGCMGCTGC